MCLTPQALALFLNLLALDTVETERDRITLSSGNGPVIWVRTGERWCTDAPQVDREKRTQAD